MKSAVIIFLVPFIFLSCDSVEPDNSETYKLPTIKIDKIEIRYNKIIATIIVGTPTPCWDYAKTVIKQNESDYTAEIYGSTDDSEACLQVLDSFVRKETIVFTSKGEKVLSFWQNDSTYVDTTITL